MYPSDSFIRKSQTSYAPHAKVTFKLNVVLAVGELSSWGRGRRMRKQAVYKWSSQAISSVLCGKWARGWTKRALGRGRGKRAKEGRRRGKKGRGRDNPIHWLPFLRETRQLRKIKSGHSKKGWLSWVSQNLSMWDVCASHRNTTQNR